MTGQSSSVLDSRARTATRTGAAGEASASAQANDRGRGRPASTAGVEGGGDVATMTAKQRVPWAAYKIDPARDRLAIFVSLVSTRVPFKGTGKEYIGDDVEEVRDAVRAAVIACCVQLRAKLLKAAAARAAAGRRKALSRYIPDVTRALVANFAAVRAHGAAFSLSSLTSTLTDMADALKDAVKERGASLLAAARGGGGGSGEAGAGAGAAADGGDGSSDDDDGGGGGDDDDGSPLAGAGAPTAGVKPRDRFKTAREGGHRDPGASATAAGSSRVPR
jgi:hypothetical protein